MEIDVLEEQNADVSQFFGGKNAEPGGALSLFFFLSDVIGRSFFVCFFSFFLERSIDRSIDREREIYLVQKEQRGDRCDGLFLNPKP